MLVGTSKGMTAKLATKRPGAHRFRSVECRRAQLEQRRRPRFPTSHLESGRKLGKETHPGSETKQLPPYNGSSSLCRYQRQLSASDSCLVALCAQKCHGNKRPLNSAHWTQANFKMFPNFFFWFDKAHLAVLQFK